MVMYYGEVLISDLGVMDEEGAEKTVEVSLLIIHYQ